MAGDLALVALGIDSSQMKSGEQQAIRSLQLVEREMQKTEQESAKLSKALSATGNAIRANGQHWSTFAVNARKGIDALGSAGGPIGEAVSHFQRLGSQLSGLTDAFGLVTGAAVGLVAVIGTAAIAGFAKLSIEGSKAADKLLDVADSTGLTIDQVQRLGAAFARSGEDVNSVEQAFRKFQSTVVEAIRNPTSEAARNLQRMGVDARKAGDDIGSAFVDSIARLKEVRTTTEGAAASNEVFGRSIGSLVRSSSELSTILKGTRKELEDTGIIANNIALGSAAQLDSQISRLSHSFETFTVILNGLGLGAGNSVFSGIASDLEAINGLLNRISKNPFIQLVIAGTLQAAQVTSPSNILGGGGPLATGRTGAGGGVGLGSGSGVGRGGGIKADDALSPEVLARLRQLKAEYDAQRVTAGNLADAISESQIRLDYLRATLREIPGGTREFASALREAQDEQAKLTALLKQPPALPTSSEEERRRLLGLIPNANPPGPNEVGAVVRETVLAQGSKSTLFTEDDRELLNREFNFIFHDFYRSIVTGRATLKEAFGNLAFGILDTFATAMLQAMQKSFIDPLVNGLTNLLTSAIDGLFGGLSGGGLGKALGGIAKFFGGFFADGGTLGAGSWGIVGEKGPEIAFSGSRPMTIMPMGAMAGGGMQLNINFAISAPGGQVNKRTQDQIADSVYNAVRRAERQRGA